MPSQPNSVRLALCGAFLSLSGCGDGVSLTQTVGADGAYLELGDFALAIPPGALTEDVELGIEIVADLDSEGLASAGDLIAGASGLNLRLTPHGQKFQMPIVVGFPGELITDDFVALRLADEDAEAWSSVGPLVRTGEDALLSISTFSIYTTASGATCPCWTPSEVADFHEQGRAWLAADGTRMAHSVDTTGDLTYTDGTAVSVATRRTGTSYNGAAYLQLTFGTPAGGTGAGTCEAGVLGSQAAADWIPNITPGAQAVASLADFEACQAGLRAHAPSAGAASYDVRLESDGGDNLRTVKALREITGLGNKEAKDIVATAPVNVLEDVEKAKADAAVTKFLAIGAVAEAKADPDVDQLATGLQVGVVATGLATGTTLTATFSGGSALTLSPGGGIVWAPESLSSGASWTVTLGTPPAGVLCTASPESGTLTAHTLVTVACVANPVESCNGVDDDGDSAIDEGFDADGDGVTTCGTDGATGTTDDDCDDGDVTVFPGATEVCDGVDGNCDGTVSPGESTDTDTDGVPDDCDAQPSTTCEDYTAADVATVRGFSGASCLIDATGAQLPAILRDNGVTSYSGGYVDHDANTFEVIGAAMDSTGATLVMRGCYSTVAGTCATLGRPDLPAGSEADLSAYEACKTVAEYACQ